MENLGSSASQEIPHILRKPQGSLPCWQKPAIYPYTEPVQFSPRTYLYDVFNL